MTATTDGYTDIEDVDIDIAGPEGDTDAEQGGRRKRRRRSGAIADRPTRSKAAQRAIDRRSRRGASRGSDRKQDNNTRHGVGVDRRDTGRRREALVARLRRVPFVVPVLGLLVLGLGLSLWLSTTAAQDSYLLGIERQENQALVDRRDQLKREYESGDSAPELSDKATRLGLVPARNPARMVVDAQGRPEVLGDAVPADGRPMGTINPEHEPNPVDQIDPDEVYDSLGLDNGNGGDADTPPPPPTPEAEGLHDDPPPPADDVAPESAPAPPAPGGPAPNVLPPNGNPPSPNSPDAR